MRSNRPYVQIDPDVLERARQIDLLSYLRAYEPSNLVKVKGTTNVYCTAEHDSLKISNGKWYWWSRGFGGYSALDYLMKVREYGFVEAVEILTGQALADWKPPPPAPKKDEPKVLLLPPKNKDCDRVTEYLFGRGIDYALIQECVADGTIYESADYHNAVFVGKDKDGTPRYAACRGTKGSFRLDASGDVYKRQKYTYKKEINRMVAEAGCRTRKDSVMIDVYKRQPLTRLRTICSRLPRMAASWGLTKGSSTRCCRTNPAQRSISA